MQSVGWDGVWWFGGLVGSLVGLKGHRLVAWGMARHQLAAGTPVAMVLSLSPQLSVPAAHFWGFHCWLVEFCCLNCQPVDDAWHLAFACLELSLIGLSFVIVQLPRSPAAINLGPPELPPHGPTRNSRNTLGYLCLWVSVIKSLFGNADCESGGLEEVPTEAWMKGSMKAD